ncbi:MAG: hypothetical protein J0M17_24100 [Planctomycetes bacterium]|nr:hypothetical protein [Planctomycetota bacterium]
MQGRIFAFIGLTLGVAGAISFVATGGPLSAAEPAAASLPTGSSPPAGAPHFVASLVRDLGHDDYHRRIRADEQLAKLGPTARAELEAAAKDPSPEVRLRAKELLRQLKIDDLWQAGKFEYSAESAAATAVLEAVSKQTGNHVLLGDQYGNFDDKPITAGYANGEFWPALDDICRRTGNRLRPHFDPREPGLVLSAGKPGRYPTAYSGPIRAQILSARRAFSEELDYEADRSEKTHTFQVNLQVMWEDRFRLTAYRSQAELVSAITDVGTSVAATQPATTGWNIAGGGARQLTMTLRLHPPATSARKLETLSLKWGLIAAGDMACLEIDDLAGTSPVYQDDVELRIETVENGPGQRCEVTLLVLREVMIKDPLEVFFQENDVELLDQAGVPYRKQAQSNSFDADGARIKLTYVGEGAESKPTKLKFHYPRVRSQRDVLITFRDVPLPNARPE